MHIIFVPLPDCILGFLHCSSFSVYTQKIKNQSKSRCYNVNSYSVFRPNDTLDEGREASLPSSRDIASEPFRRELISNLAEHILFSKCYGITVRCILCFAECKN